MKNPTNIHFKGNLMFFSIIFTEQNLINIQFKMSQEGAIPPSKGGDGTDLKKWITEYAEQVKQVVVDFQGLLLF